MNQIFLGDCRDSMRQLINDGVKVQCIVSSPPYWGLRDYGCHGQIGLEPTFSEFLAQLVEVFELCRQLLTDDGTLWLNMGDSYAGSWGSQGRQGHGEMTSRSIVSARQIASAARRSNKTGSPERLPQNIKPKDMIGQPWRLAFALQDAGWWLRQDIIWSKPNPMPESVRDRCTKSHEYLFLLTKSDRYYFDQDAIRETAGSGREPRGVGFGHGTDADTRQRARVRSPANWKTGAGAHGAIHADGRERSVTYNEADVETRNKRSVWTVATQPYPDAHFATFPEALVEPCILAGSRPGDLVFDPFMGSGTVAQVAQRMGRRWLGCELNPEYVALINQRTQQLGMAL